jgi:ribonuclease P protein component
VYLRKKSLTRKERLCKKNDLQWLFKNGARVKYKGCVLLYAENTCGITRFVVIARKGFQNAVKRNRQKRLAREAYRYLKENIKTGYDFVLFVVPGTYSFNDLLCIEHFLFKRARVFTIE